MFCYARVIRRAASTNALVRTRRRRASGSPRGQACRFTTHSWVCGCLFGLFAEFPVISQLSPAASVEIKLIELTEQFRIALASVQVNVCHDRGFDGSFNDPELEDE
eukprot:1178749-Prorocentrum_minimum.AAC.1